jgi:hypothetical protein
VCVCVCGGGGWGWGGGCTCVREGRRSTRAYGGGGGGGGGVHVRACTRRLTCPLLPNANFLFRQLPTPQHAIAAHIIPCSAAVRQQPCCLAAYTFCVGQQRRHHAATRYDGYASRITRKAKSADIYASRITRKSLMVIYIGLRILVARRALR